MKCNDFDTIKFKMPSTYRNIGTTQKSCIALDTETNNGIPFLLADSNGNYSRSKAQIINQLLSLDYDKTLNVFYNLGYDKNVILKLLDY
ncbi:MAG: DNA polymerase, partial [Candidatus Aenigmarchaeota archaeon]|nr:DNA polymerase [Candidatus Aenigmarchaeota archaeon]